MKRACLCALAFCLWLATPAGATAPYEALPAPVASDLARCDAEIRYRTQPSRMGRFFGALFDTAQAPASTYSRGVAVVVGVSEYDYQTTRLKPLPGVKADVAAMADFLAADSGGGQGYDAVIVLRDAQVTQSNVFCVVRALGRMSRPDEVNPDRLLFYWSGHGVDVVEGGGRVGYLPYFGVSRDDVNETTALDMRKIATWAAGYFAGFRQAVFLIDSCVSGYATLTRGGASERGAVSIKMPDPAVGYDRFMRDLKGLSEQYRMVITAANQEDPAYENVSGGDFTQSFLHLMRSGSPDLVWRGDIFQTSLVDRMGELQHRRRQQAASGQPQVDAIPEPQLELFLGRRQSSFLVPADPQLLDLFESLEKARAGEVAAGQAGAPARTTSDPTGSSQESRRSVFTDFCSGGAQQRIDALSDEELIRRDAICEVTLLSNPDDMALHMSRAEILLERARRAAPELAPQHYAAAQKELDVAGPQGWARIAALIYDGLGFERSEENDRRMIELAQRAHEAGDRRQAANVLGLAYLNERGTARQAEKGVAYLEEASVAGDPNAAQNLALEYRSQTRYEAALDAFLRAAELGKVDSFMYAANLYFDGQLPGEQAERDAQARRLVERALAADGDNPWALNYYGWLYRSGRGLEHDDAKAAVYFERSQKLGYLQAAINLGSMRRSGEGGAQDFAQAASLFDGACRQDYVAGCTELADMKFDGDGFERTPDVLADAARLVEKALALDGENRFATELKAYALRNGAGLPSDLAQAEVYYRKATSLGSLWAFYQLGTMLRDQAVGLDGEARQQMLGRALDVFEQGIALNDSWSMVGKAALIMDGLVSTGKDARVEVPDLLRKPDSEDLVAAFDLLVRLYTTTAFGEPDRQAALPVVKRLAERQTPEAKRWLALLVRDGTLYLPADHGLVLLPPWEYYAACAGFGWASCYGEAGDSLLAMATRDDALSDGEAMGFYSAPRGQAAADLARTYYEKGAQGGDVRSRLAIATLKMADGSVLGGAEAKTLLAGLRDEGHDAGTVGLVVAGLDDDRPVIDFQAAFAAIRGMTVACIHNVQVFQGVETPFWPGFGCGRGDLSWPNWTLGLAQTKSRLNLRNRPGGGQVIAELAPQTPLVYLRYPQETSKGWLKVHTPADQIGWVKASYLAPWQEKSAEQ